MRVRSDGPGFRLPAFGAMEAARVIYYSYFSGHGRSLLADELGAVDPFGLCPADIPERVLALGYTPALDHPMDQPWPRAGTATEVQRDG